MTKQPKSLEGECRIRRLKQIFNSLLLNIIKKNYLTKKKKTHTHSYFEEFLYFTTYLLRYYIFSDDLRTDNRTLQAETPSMSEAEN